MLPESVGRTGTERMGDSLVWQYTLLVIYIYISIRILVYLGNSNLNMATEPRVIGEIATVSAAVEE